MRREGSDLAPTQCFYISYLLTPVNSDGRISRAVINHPRIDNVPIQHFEITDACLEPATNDLIWNGMSTLTHTLSNSENGHIRVGECKKKQRDPIAHCLPAWNPLRICTPRERSFERKALSL